jgi:transposase-like protein
VLGWVYRYRENGTLAFLNTGKKSVYTPELKLKAVQSYLRGEGSLRAVAAKYGLRNAE